MGNNLCPNTDLPRLTSIARDICPFPNYIPSPLFINMLSINSSLHLKNHYMDVQSTLTPKQLEDFTQSLRTTFGREGKVTLGGVGVVALSLAVLFDTLARQVRGERVSESEPIPGLFLKDPRGYYPPHVYTISEYLRLVPHIANNPTRIKEETERYHKQFMNDHLSLGKLGENHTLPITEDVPTANRILSYQCLAAMQHHHLRIKNATDNELVKLDIKDLEDVISTLNCDPEMLYKDFFFEVQKYDSHIQETFKQFLSSEEPKTWLHKIAQMEVVLLLFHFLPCSLGDTDAIIAQREDFDLNANALGRWPQ